MSSTKKVWLCVQISRDFDCPLCGHTQSYTSQWCLNVTEGESIGCDGCGATLTFTDIERVVTATITAEV